MTEPLLYVLVDAVRHDYLSPRVTPVMHRLAQEHGVRRMRPLLGYSDSIRATIFTGRYPDEHGYWMEYCFRPESSPFSGLGRLSPLDGLPLDIARRATKVGLSRTVVPRLARRHGYHHLSLRHIPYRAISQFDWTLREDMDAPGALGAPTLFDTLGSDGAGWSYLDSSKLGRSGLLSGLDRLDPRTRFLMVYLHYVDMASHVVGLRSGLFTRSLARTDSLVGEVLDRARSRLGPLRSVVFSDHGMSTVKRIVDFPGLWRHPAFPERFCFALDATMVRLWFHDDDPELRASVRSYVERRSPGRYLEVGELRSLRLPFPDRRYGEELYLLPEGTAIFPNFHSMLSPKAMHAYHPDGLEQHGILIGLPGHDEQAELVELAPAALEHVLGRTPALAA